MRKLFSIGIMAVWFLIVCSNLGYCAQGVVDTGLVEEILDEIDAQYAQFFGWDYFSKLWQGEQELNVADVWQGLVGYVRLEIDTNFAFAGKLLFLAVFSAILGNLQQAFGQSIGQMARLVMFFLTTLLVMEEAQNLWLMANTTTDRLISFMDAILPVQLVLLVASGGVTTAGLLEPMLFLLVNIIGNFTKKLLLPGIYFCLILALVNAMSEKYRLSKLQKLLKRVLFAVFSGINSLLILIMSLSGVSSALVDTLAVRGLKYAAGSVPIVGDILVNAAQITVGGAVLVKNVLGIMGLFIVVMLVFLPAVKILLLGWLLKLTAAVIEPIGEEMLGELLSSSGECVILLFAAMMVVGVMCFLSMAILVGISQLVLML